MAKPDNWAKNDKFWQSLRIKQYGKEWQNYEEEAKENCIWLHNLKLSRRTGVSYLVYNDTSCKTKENQL